MFEFEQFFQSGPDAGSLKFHFQISVWQNTNHFTAEEWAKRIVKPQLTLETRSVEVAGRKGVRVKTTNLAWTIMKIFVVDKACACEVNYLDLDAPEMLLPRRHAGALDGCFQQKCRTLSTFYPRIVPQIKFPQSCLKALAARWARNSNRVKAPKHHPLLCRGQYVIQ